MYLNHPVSNKIMQNSRGREGKPETRYVPFLSRWNNLPVENLKFSSPVKVIVTKDSNCYIATEVIIPAISGSRVLGARLYGPINFQANLPDQLGKIRAVAGLSQTQDEINAEVHKINSLDKAIEFTVDLEDFKRNLKAAVTAIYKGDEPALRKVCPDPIPKEDLSIEDIF